MENILEPGKVFLEDDTRPRKIEVRCPRCGLLCCIVHAQPVRQPRFMDRMVVKAQNSPELLAGRDGRK